MKRPWNRKAERNRRIEEEIEGDVDERSTMRWPSKTSHRAIESIAKPTSIAIAPRYVTNSADAAIWHAERDGGLTMALAYQVAEHVKIGKLKVVLAAFEPPALPIHLVYPTSRWLSAKVRAFVDLTTEICDWRFSELA